MEAKKDVDAKELKIIDLLVFGRSGVGKSSLLKALTNDDAIIVGHGSTQTTMALASFEKRFMSASGQAYAIRYWDTLGVDKWTTDFDGRVTKEIEHHNIKPLAVIFCTSTGGRVDTQSVAAVLSKFRNQNIHISFIVTRCFSLTLDEFHEAMQDGSLIMEAICGKPKKSGKDFANYSGGFFGFVNSVRFKSAYDNFYNSTQPLHNIEQLMESIAESLDEAELHAFIVATLNNRTFWQEARERIWPRVKNWWNGLFPS